MLRCGYCEIICTSYEDWLHHLVSLQHQTKLGVSDVFVKHGDEDRDERSILMCNMNPKTSPFEVVLHYAKTEPVSFITDVYMHMLPNVKENFYLIVFDQKKFVDRIISLHEKYGDQRVITSMVHCKRKTSLSESSWKSKLETSFFYRRHRFLQTQFPDMNWDHQLTKLLPMISLESKGYQQRENVMEELESLLHEECEDFQNATVNAYGSCMTWLADVNADLDVYLDATGEGGRGDLDPDQRFEIMSQVQKIFGDKYGGINVYSTRNGKVPIIILQHPSGLKIDISFDNCLSVQNSKMIRLMSKLDYRVRPFLIFLRYWARYHNLIGSHSIKSYALILMALVYLRLKKIIPSVCEVQNLEGVRTFMVCNWNASYCSNRDYVQKQLPWLKCFRDPSSTDGMGHEIMKLCYGFFTEYATFDFDNMVICPFIGESLAKRKFESVNGVELPTEMGLLKANLFTGQCLPFQTNRPICIQDPYCLNVNVMSNCDKPEIMYQFKTACTQAMETLKPFIKTYGLAGKEIIIDLCCQPISQEKQKEIMMRSVIPVVLKESDKHHHLASVKAEATTTTPDDRLISHSYYNHCKSDRESRSSRSENESFREREICRVRYEPEIQIRKPKPRSKSRDRDRSRDRPSSSNASSRKTKKKHRDKEKSRSDKKSRDSDSPSGKHKIRQNRKSSERDHGKSKTKTANDKVKNKEKKHKKIKRSVAVVEQSDFKKISPSTSSADFKEGKSEKRSLLPPSSPRKKKRKSSQDKIEPVELVKVPKIEPLPLEEETGKKQKERTTPIRKSVVVAVDKGREAHSKVQPGEIFTDKTPEKTKSSMEILSAVTLKTEVKEEVIEPQVLDAFQNWLNEDKVNKMTFTVENTNTPRSTSREKARRIVTLQENSKKTKPIKQKQIDEYETEMEEHTPPALIHNNNENHNKNAPSETVTVFLELPETAFEPGTSFPNFALFPGEMYQRHFLWFYKPLRKVSEDNKKARMLPQWANFAADFFYDVQFWNKLFPLITDFESSKSDEEELNVIFESVQGSYDRLLSESKDQIITTEENQERPRRIFKAECLTPASIEGTEDYELLSSIMLKFSKLTTSRRKRLAIGYCFACHHEVMVALYQKWMQVTENVMDSVTAVKGPLDIFGEVCGEIATQKITHSLEPAVRVKVFVALETNVKKVPGVFVGFQNDELECDPKYEKQAAIYYVVKALIEDLLPKYVLHRLHKHFK